MMKIKLSACNRPTKPGLYLMKLPHEAPQLVRVHLSGVYGATKAEMSLSVSDSRSHYHYHSPLNELMPDGGKWQWFVSPQAKFSAPLTFGPP